MPEKPLSPDCPWCGNPPHMNVGTHQAMCGTEGCPCWIWNPSVTPAENRRNASRLDTPWDEPKPGPDPGTGDAPGE